MPIDDTAVNAQTDGEVVKGPGAPPVSPPGSQTQPPQTPASSPAPGSGSSSGAGSAQPPSAGSTATPSVPTQAQVSSTGTVIIAAPKADMAPEHAMGLLRGEMSKLHTLIANVGHYATLPFTESEKAISEIASLFATIRKHV